MKIPKISKYAACKSSVITLVFLFINSIPLYSQVHYKEDGKPWSNRTTKGPDAAVPGWFYNLGITGIRAQLTRSI